MILVDADRIGVSRPGRTLFENVSVTVSNGDRLGIVGINGTGKSTLLKVLAGKAAPERGAVRTGAGVRVGYLEQSPALSGGTVGDTVGGGWQGRAVLDRLGMGGLGDRSVSELSGGQSTRVAMATVLSQEWDLLLMDEPTNHLDIDAIVWLEEWLASFRGALVLVTHDRHLLDACVTRILELDRGGSYLHDGGYAGYLQGRADRDSRAAASEQSRRNRARRELEWLRRGAPARTSKSKARIASATELIERSAPGAARPGELDFAIDAPRLGDVSVELHDVSMERAGRVLFSHLDLALDRRERLGIVGPNGVGKSTLLHLLAGRLEPTSGRRVQGTTAAIELFDQHGESLDPASKVREVIAGPHRAPDYRDAALAESFWFDTDAQWAPVELLSGGERRRLQLVATLARQPNVLMLDEPTNDLDIETLRALEEFVDAFPGAVVVVSHDRAFLERTVSDVIVLDGDGTARRWPGGFGAWEVERRARRRRGRADVADVARPSGTDPHAAGRDGRGVSTGGEPNAAAPAAQSARSSEPRPVSPSTLRHSLRRAQREVDELTRQRDELSEKLSSGAPFDELAQLGSQLAEVETALADTEERWLGLAAQAEERGLSVEG